MDTKGILNIVFFLLVVGIFLISKFHMHPVGLELTMSLYILLLWDEEVPVELLVIGLAVGNFESAMIFNPHCWPLSYIIHSTVKCNAEKIPGFHTF